MARASVSAIILLLNIWGSYHGGGALSPPRNGNYAQPAPNIALKGIATQSSTDSYLGNAGNANDGSLAANYLRSQCSYTKKDSEPWWRVNLKAQYKIMSVAITNRVLEGNRERIFGAEIRIGNDRSEGGRLNPRCGVISSIESGETLSFSCQGMVGQYVTVTIPGREEHLVLCEVQVYGFPVDGSEDATVPKVLKTPNGAPNVALKGIAQQSSLYNMYGEPKNAIDGSLDSNFLHIQCAGTSIQENPWWMVNLKSEFKVFTVTVTNRGDCCAERINEAEIRIGNSGETGGTENPICGVITSLGYGQTVSFECHGMVGQFVTVFIPGAERSVTICEVQVFALPNDGSDEGVSIVESISIVEGASVDFPKSNRTFLDIWGLLSDYFDDNSEEEEVTEHEGLTVQIVTKTFMETEKDSHPMRSRIQKTMEDLGRTLSIDRSVSGDNLAFRGISSQSSLYDKLGASENAIDGSPSTIYLSGHCSHTDLDVEPWWRVDLMHVYNITKVKIRNRGDCCQERIDGAEVRIGNSPDKGGAQNPRCAKIESLGLGKEEEYVCRMVGRYVTVTIPGRAEYLTLCEVKVYGSNVSEGYIDSPLNPDFIDSEEHSSIATELRNILKHSNTAPNVAMTATTTQSSTDGGNSSNSIDGNLKVCSKTAVEEAPWWTIDLGSNHKVFSIAVTSQSDSSAQDLDAAKIHVGFSATGWKKNAICGTVSSIGPGETFSFNCNEMEGRYVTIVLPDKVASLSLCEVQVFAISVDTPSGDWNGDLEVQHNHHGVKNVAPQGIPAQSSYYSKRSEIMTSIDGSLSSNYLAGECTHTRKELSPWWNLDLKSRYRISSVAITNRGDCCRERINGAEIRIGDSAENGGIENSRCGVVFRMNYGETLSFDCRGMEGRYITIVIPEQKQYLSLCEVQVFGELSETFEKGKEELSENPLALTTLEDRYFLFPEESITNYVVLTPAKAMRLTSFTLCMKLSLNVSEDRETILFSYRTLYYDELNLWLEANGDIGFYMSGEGIMFPKLDKSKEWNHLCLTWESKHGRCELWVNGRRSVNTYRKRHTVRPGGIAILGQDQDELGNGFDKSQSYIGKIKDLNMWNKVLPLKSIRSVFKGKEIRKGDIFDWSNLSYSIKGNVEVVSDQSS